MRVGHAAKDDDLRAIDVALSGLIRYYSGCPACILTEDDLRFQLCRSLFPHFGEQGPSKDEALSISMHSEVRWYGDEDEDKNYRSDVVLIELPDLKASGLGRVPTKRYAFNQAIAVFECKLRRANDTKHGESFFQDVEKDLAKLAEIRDWFLADAFSYVPELWAIAIDKRSERRDLRVPEGVSLALLDEAGAVRLYGPGGDRLATWLANEGQVVSEFVG